MTVLGIDSATREASVALVEDGALVGEERRATLSRSGPEITKRPSNHSETILPLIETLLARNQTKIERLSGISVSLGPGSFTGLRISLATAQGLAYESGVPLVGVSTLLAIARRIKQANALVGSIVDARKSEVYCALFRIVDGELTRITPDELSSTDGVIQSWRAHIMQQGQPLFLLGDGAKAYERRFLDAFTEARVLDDDSFHSIAAEVARLGVERLTRASGREAETLVPVYLRSAAAETKARRDVKH